MNMKYVIKAYTASNEELYYGGEFESEGIPTWNTSLRLVRIFTSLDEAKEVLAGKHFTEWVVNFYGKKIAPRMLECSGEPVKQISICEISENVAVSFNL